VAKKPLLSPLLLVNPSLLKPLAKLWHCTGDSLVATRGSLGDHKRISRGFKQGRYPQTLIYY
jgi:hypothetical protein